MKIEDFIAQWAQIKVEDPIMVIPIIKEATPDFKIITDGTSKTGIKSFYTWSCTDRCLYKDGVLVCCKTNNVYLVNEDYIEYLRKPFVKLDIHAYVFKGEVHTQEELFSKALARFYECATKSEMVHEVVFQVVKSLNLKYENKYLDHCKNLTIDQFREVTKKHLSRNPGIIKKQFTGLWYK